MTEPMTSPAPVPAPPPEKRMQKRRSIGEWDFVKTIGAGSMGQVKLAKSRVTGELCAVKVIPKATAQHKRPPDEEAKESDISKDIRTVREAAIGKLLHHKYICEMREMYTMTNHYYMVFEYVAGGQMLDYIISHGSLKERHARKFARAIGSALDYCHQNSIVHRDLKIENILISKSGDIKLIDFGLSNLFAPNSQLKTFCGSLYFAAPELLKARPYIGPEVDVWSFGVVLYVLVCGKVPFDDKNMPLLHAKIKQGKVEYPNFLSPECKDILARMLVVNPLQRATLAEILQHPWMSRGYEGPPDSYIPYREPLTLPLDPQVVQEMSGFEFGSEAEIAQNLAALLESPEYILACHNWYKAHESSPSTSRFSFDLLKRTSGGMGGGSSDSIDLTATPMSTADPTAAYHPLISVYYLVRERLERDARREQERAGAPFVGYRQGAGSGSGSDEFGHHSGHHSGHQHSHSGHVSIPAPPTVVPPPEAAHSHHTHTHSQYSPFLSGQGPSRINVCQREAGSKTGWIRHSWHSQQCEVLFGGTRQSSAQASGPFGISIGGYGCASSNASGSHVTPHSSQDGVDGPPQTPPTRPTATFAPGSAQQPPTTTRKQYHPSARAKSMGHVRKESINTKAAAPPSESMPPVPQEFEDDVAPVQSRQHHVKMDDVDLADHTPTPSIDYPKQVFLKGFFSVQSTSTKSLPFIRSDIIRVLTQLGVRFKEIRGGFMCIHEPSLAREEDPSPGHLSPRVDTGDTSSLSPPGSPANAHWRKLSFNGRRRDHSGSGHFDFSDDFSCDSFGGSTERHHAQGGGSDMLGYTATNSSVRTPLQFEIYIVKVPILSLHGVQFKKMTGNSWQYKNLAGKILAELKL
ncbi:kinase-like domain-containing protein [Yarrowia lipolytica]|uniref:non-specific serine/threonine protein kinase n=1 Tax=Yarrowia lipolytica TaxID=4952 RepID=A0A371CA88_YARLL|nr:kinase-like domain-containing protein [Yarrowia lipolytica]RDW52348.1 kinase-like domain-containing protein [Yarrowia lipolytica]